ncbi:hypothetical protein AC249_AIPGENE6720 [Exaiptasia diaphana]|nr:hypothetical protein AC249_AIPGENE6720 [Exaiptasia diaphana]
MLQLAKKAKLEEINTDFSLCILCQSNSNSEQLVENPKSYEKVLKFVEERASYNDANYPDIWKRLKDSSAETLKSKTASWHRTCYQNTVHTVLCKRAREKYLKRTSDSTTSSEDLEASFTRSKTRPFDRTVCFFCNGAARYQEPLHEVSTENAGISLKNAIDIKDDLKLKVKLSTAIDSHDAHAVDIKYHRLCWMQNVSNVLRKAKSNHSSHQEKHIVAAKIEFLTMVERALENGEVLNTAVVQKAYEDILSSNSVTASSSCSRKMVRQLLLNEIPGIEFHKSSRVNEPDKVTIKKTRDSAVEEVESRDTDDDFKTLFKAASILRKAIAKSDMWTFTGSLHDVTEDNLPNELYSFFRWVIQGPRSVITEGEKDLEVHRRASSLSQSTIGMFLSDRQTKNKKSQKLNSSREMPQQVAVGLAVHQAARSKKLVNILNGFGMSCEYNKLLRIEAQIETTVLDRMQLNGGVYLPPDIVKGRHVFFAIDNVDFSEDTPDGKRNLHGTAMAIYQQCKPEDKVPDLILSENAPIRRSIRDLPPSLTDLLTVLIHHLDHQVPSILPSL